MFGNVFNEEKEEKKDNKIQEIIEYDNIIKKLKKFSSDVLCNYPSKQNKLKDIIKEFTTNNQLISAKLKSNEDEKENELNLKEKKIEELNNSLSLKLEEINKLENLNIKVKEMEKKFQLKENELMELKEHYKLKENEIEKLKINYEKEIKGLKDNFNSKEKKSEEINEKLKAKINELNKIDIKNKSLYKDIENKTNIINNLKKELDTKDKKYEKIITHFEEITNQNKKLKEAEMEIKMKEEENKNLKQKNEKLSKNNATDKAYFDEEGNKNYYDVVIEIDSINTLTKNGWKINYNENNKEKYEKIIKEETLKIGVLGLNNVGKSFILSLLAGLEIPTGFSIETKGISIKCTEDEEKK